MNSKPHGWFYGPGFLFIFPSTSLVRRYLERLPGNFVIISHFSQSTESPFCVRQCLLRGETAKQNLLNSAQPFQGGIWGLQLKQDLTMNQPSFDGLGHCQAPSASSGDSCDISRAEFLHLLPSQALPARHKSKPSMKELKVWKIQFSPYLVQIFTESNWIPSSFKELIF